MGHVHPAAGLAPTRLWLGTLCLAPLCCSPDLMLTPSPCLPCPATSPQVHLPHPYIKTTCKKLGVEWADALVGFERRKGMNFPSIQVGERVAGWLGGNCMCSMYCSMYWLHGLPTGCMDCLRAEASWEMVCTAMLRRAWWC